MAEQVAMQTPMERARDYANLGLLEAGVGELDVMLKAHDMKRIVLEHKRAEAMDLITKLRKRLRVPEF